MQQLVIFYYESLRKVIQEDKKIYSYLILKRGAAAPRYIYDMSHKKRAMMSTLRITWGTKKPRGPKNLRGPGKRVAIGTCQNPPPPPPWTCAWLYKPVFTFIFFYIILSLKQIVHCATIEYSEYFCDASCNF